MFPCKTKDRNSEDFCHFWNYVVGIIMLNILPSKIDSDSNKKTKIVFMRVIKYSSFKPSWALFLKQTSKQTMK